MMMLCCKTPEGANCRLCARKIGFEDIKSQKQYFIIYNYVCIHLKARVLC